jgi:uncharacterized membrane protein YhhN
MVILLAEVVLHLLPSMSWVTIFTKPLLMPLLFIWVHTSKCKNYVLSAGTSRLYALLLGGIILGWIGDVTLMVDHPMAFPMGILAFLVNHVFYITIFYRLAGKLKLNATIGLLIAVYVAVFCTILWPSLGYLKIPVLVYSMVIGFMFWFALGIPPLTNHHGKYFIAAGAALFVLSDSVLAFNRFRFSLPGAEAIVMLTYGTAQFMIAKGVLDGLGLTGFDVNAAPEE